MVDFLERATTHSGGGLITVVKKSDAVDLGGEVDCEQCEVSPKVMKGVTLYSSRACAGMSEAGKLRPRNKSLLRDQSTCSATTRPFHISSNCNQSVRHIFT